MQFDLNTDVVCNLKSENNLILATHVIPVPGNGPRPMGEGGDQHKLFHK